MSIDWLRSGHRLACLSATLAFGFSASSLIAQRQADLGAHGNPHANAVSIDTTNPIDWKISNGVLNIDFNPSAGNIFSMTMAATGDQLVDNTTLNSNGQPKGFYMDNAGFGSSTPIPGYDSEPASGAAPAYLDWWVTYPSNSKNAYTYSEHWIVTAGDPGLHVYFVANHAASDIAGSIGQVQWVFRDSLSLFTNTFSVDPSVNNPGVTTVPLPPASEMFSTDPGRNVQDATVDLHGLPVPAGYTRQFYTKYDYAGYEYLHHAHGLYGDKYGIWTVLPSKESLVGGPSKQDLYFTGNLLMIEAYSNHLDNPLTLATPSGQASSRLFGPFYVRVNQFPSLPGPLGKLLANDPSLLYLDALIAGNSHTAFYDHETQLLDSGYVPSYDRGTVLVHVNGVTGLGSTPTKSAWAVLSDPNKNFQFSSAGAQYWADISRDGTALFPRVIPGTYRLSVYVLGQFGELRQDNIVVTKGSFTNSRRSPSRLKTLARPSSTSAHPTAPHTSSSTATTPRASTTKSTGAPGTTGPTSKPTRAPSSTTPPAAPPVPPPTTSTSGTTTTGASSIPASTIPPTTPKTTTPTPFRPT